MARVTQSEHPPVEGSRPSASAVREHLRAMLESPEFQGSQRSREFLDFIVRTALDGHPEQIKERTIAEMVFGRQDYDPATDTLVRVTAGEVRKRLTRFYDANPAIPMRISLASGGYVPAFLISQEPVPAEAVPAAAAAPVARWRSRAAYFALAGLLVVVLAGAALLLRQTSPLEELWQPMLQGGDPVIVANPAGKRPTYVVYPKQLDDFQRALRAGAPSIPIGASEIEESNRNVSVGNMLAILSIAGFLRDHGKGVLPRIASGLAPGDTRNHPVILVGAFSNPWTLDQSRARQFRFFRERDGAGWRQGLLDARTGRQYVSQLRNHALEADLDYAIVSRVWSGSGQVVLTVAGVSEFGTQVAGEFVTNPHSWGEVVRQAPPGWQKKNMEILLETKVVGGSPGLPKLIEVHFW